MPVPFSFASEGCAAVGDRWASRGSHCQVVFRAGTLSGIVVVTTEFDDFDAYVTALKKHASVTECPDGINVAVPDKVRITDLEERVIWKHSSPHFQTWPSLML